MPEIVEIALGPWWRFDAYELRRGYLRPKPGAQLHQYDPWAEYRQAIGEGGQQRSRGSNREWLIPYEELLNLTRELTVKIAKPSGYPRLDRADEERLLAWLAEHGLLGILPGRAETVTTALRWGKGQSATCAQYWKAAHGWCAVNMMLFAPDDGRVLTPRTVGAVVTPRHRRAMGWPEPGVGIYCDSPHSTWTEDDVHESATEVAFKGGGYATVPVHHLRFEPLARTWARFFPDVRRRESETYDYPEPGGERFWEMYAEPLLEFMAEAAALGRVLEELASEQLPARGLRMLEELVRPVVPSLERTQNGSLRQKWVCPSLLTSFAMMALLDQAEGRRLLRCDCGRLFVPLSPKAEYCSERCRARVQMRRYRQRLADKETQS